MRLHVEPPSVLDVLEAHFGSAECRSLLSGVPESLARRALPEPAKDFLSRGGRRFRARLVELAWELARSGRSAPPLASELPLMIELLHAGSLIIDDVQDDAEHRRGAPALHLTWGVPVAINTGNWLYFLPQLLLQRAGLPASTELSLHRAVSRALVWCHQGQALDLRARSYELGREEVGSTVAAISRLKTGTLMELAATVGAVAAEADERKVAVLARFGSELGVGLQMLNDLVGLRTASQRDGEDLRAARVTWCWAWAAEQFALDEYEQLKTQARAIAEDGADLRPLARALEGVFEPGARAAKAHLDRSLHLLRGEFGPLVATAELEREVQRLMDSHV